ncbi:MAG: leucine-rich repeat protein [Candidatus Methanomethylophilus sp.]|nr:leucine-rich repeat protein [Methanomethylophilus sp.]MCI2074787.1 leucine-rich repeat protein [Methanomethylophilus sp.]MCI2092293.1 leucine-rich repeat protein [Methanomethylophilus sp.]
MASYSSDSPAPWYDYKNDVKKLIVGDNITGIGAYAFYDCISIESVTIGDSVASIGEFAFGYCKSLESVTIPDSVVSICNSAFTYCDSLESVTIGDSVSSIEDYAFYNCSAILSFNVPSSVKDIGTGAFSGIGTFKYSDGGSELETTVDNLSGHTWERNSKSDPFLSYETLSYDGNGSSGGSTASQSVENGGSLIISDNGFTKVGYRFTGWNTQANGGGEELHMPQARRLTMLRQTSSFMPNGLLIPTPSRSMATAAHPAPRPQSALPMTQIL